MVALNTGFPSGPIVDPGTGELTVIGRAFFIALWNRTGAAVGISAGDAAASIAAETAARQAADVGLTADVSAEGTTRATADSALGARITNEAMIRASADSALQVQMVGANLPAILTEDAITSLKVSAMPAVDTATLAGTELFTATQAGVNAKWTLGSLYTVLVDLSDYLPVSPLDAAVGSGVAGLSVVIMSGAGDGVGQGGDFNFEAGAGGSDATGGGFTLRSGDGGGANAGGDMSFTSGSSGTGATGNAGLVRLSGGNANSTDGDGGDILLGPGSGSGAGRAGQLITSLPTSDPTVGDAVWADNGTLVLSGSTATAPLNIGTLPAIDIPTLDGTELFVAEQAAANTSWSLASLYTVTVAIGNFLANPLNAAAASNIDGAPVIFQGGAGDTDSNGGGAAFFGGPAAGVGAGGDVGLQGGAGSGTTGSSGGEASVFGGNASGGDSDGGSAVLRGGNSTGTGFAGWATVVGADAAGVGGTAGSVLIQAGSGTTAGQVYVANLPIADPVDGNAVWLDTGVLVLSGSTVGGAFAASDLSGLPIADPGGGLPWLNAGVLTVGP